jgi:hypothetical protein
MTRPLLIAAGLYTFVTIALTYPLIVHLGSAFPHDPGDPALNTWILWWNARTVPLTSAWWNAPAFYPLPGVLSFSENLLGLSLISSPVQWAGGSALLAYNIVFLLTFPLCALGAYLLVWELTRRNDAALVAGMLFGFAPYRMAHIPHLQVLAAFGMPFALLGLHRYLRDLRTRWLVVFAGAWLLQALSNGYYLLFFTTLVALWILWFLRMPADAARLRAIAIAGGVAALPLIPLLWNYKVIHERLGFARDFGTMRHFGADVLALLDVEPALALWGWLQVYRRSEGQLFPGLTVVLIIAAAVCVFWRELRRRDADAVPAPRLRMARRLLFALLVLTGSVAVLIRPTGPWDIRISGVQLFTVSNPVKPLTWALGAAILLLLTSTPVRRAFRSRSVLGFYATAAFLMWLLSLGPAPTLNGEEVMYRGPYALLMHLPGFSSLRVPARFWMMSVLCLSVAGAMLFDRLGVRLSKLRPAFTVVVVLAIAAESWVSVFVVEPVPEIWRPQPCEPPRGSQGAVLELPLGATLEDVGAMYRSISHGRPTLNGYSGYFPPHYIALRFGLNMRDPDVLTQLADHGLEYVLIDRGHRQERALRRYVAGVDGAESICSTDALALFRLTKRQQPPRPGPPLPVASLAASVNGPLLGLALDRDLTTRWTTGPQTADMMLEIDLGKIQEVGALELSLGDSPRDFPRSLRIDASDDGATWRQVWQGTSAGHAVMAAVVDPVAMPLVYDLRAVSTRYLRLSLLSADKIFYWSIAELRVLGR